MEHPLSDLIALLARMPASLDALLRGLPESWTHRAEGGKTWTAFDVVGHLNHLEQGDWMVRVRTVLESGETKAFEPIDREAQLRENQGRSLADLLDSFMQLRAQNIAELRALDLRPQDLERRGRHPALGSVTLSQLLSAWAVHDLTHLHQLSRIMAHQYSDAVGPWRPYLGVLHCEGHSRG